MHECASPPETLHLIIVKAMDRRGAYGLSRIAKRPHANSSAGGRRPLLCGACDIPKGQAGDRRPQETGSAPASPCSSVPRWPESRTATSRKGSWE